MPAAKKTSSTAVAKRPAANIVSIREQLKKQAEDMNNRTAPASGNMIQVTQDKKMILPDGTKTEELNAVIVEFTAANYFFDSPFNKDDIHPPACFAIGTNPMKLAPSPNSPNKQAADCASCPMNEFGSNGSAKACKNTRVLALLPPDASADTPIWLLKTSPTANKAFDAYVKSIASTFQSPPLGVVTRITFDENSSYASLRFSDPQPNENIELHFSRQAEAAKILATEPDVSQYTKPAPAPARKGGAARR